MPPGSPLDLRPQKPTERTLTVPIGSAARDDLARCLVERPAITYAGPRALRDSAEFFSAAERWLTPSSRLLDLGCGPRDQAVVAEYLRLSYVGVDFDSVHADLLCDAHAIPFAGGSFDAVFAYAVLEHLDNPFLVVREVARVLAANGIFFGAVSQGEPFHESFFHHTALGLLTVLRGAGLHAVRLWPSYDTLHSLSQMGRYPKPQRLLIEGVYRFGKAFPFLAPRKFFRWSARDKAIDELHRAASICFVAEKA